jgi:hypothetical protein
VHYHPVLLFACFPGEFVTIGPDKPGLFTNFVARGRKMIAGKEGELFDRKRIEIR